MADQKLTTVPSKYTVNEPQTPFAKATTYNNYYEFGTDKSDPAKHAHTLKTRPWTVQVAGMVKKPQTIGHRHADELQASGGAASTGIAAWRRGRW